MTENRTSDESIEAGFPPDMTAGLRLYDIETLFMVANDLGGLATADSVHRLCARGLLTRVERGPVAEKTMGLGQFVSSYEVCAEAARLVSKWSESRALRLPSQEDPKP